MPSYVSLTPNSSGFPLPNSAVQNNVPSLPPPFIADSTANPNYILRLRGTDEQNNPIGVNGNGIYASLPEQFGLSLFSHWTSLLANPSLSSALGSMDGIHGSGLGSALSKYAHNLAHGARAYNGMTDLTPALTTQIWQDTSPVEFSLPFVFNAVYDPEVEVMGPLYELAKLSSPGTYGPHNELIQAPGPNIHDAIKHKGYKISLRIGQLLTFRNVIVTGIHGMLDSMFTVNGDLLSCQVDVSMRTSTILTKDDIAHMFNFTNMKNATAPQNNRYGTPQAVYT